MNLKKIKILRKESIITYMRGMNMEISLVEFLRLVISPRFGSKIAGARIDQCFVTSHLSRRGLSNTVESTPSVRFVNFVPQ